MEEDKFISENCEISLELVQKFKNELAKSLYKNNPKIEKICSNSIKNTLKNTIFDRCFYYGLPSNVITEIFGPAGTGKTQVCLHLIAQTLIRDNSSKSLYISTQERFRIERFKSFLGLSLNESVLDRLHLQYFLEPEPELHFLSFGLHLAFLRLHLLFLSVRFAFLNVHLAFLNAHLVFLNVYFVLLESIIVQSRETLRSGYIFLLYLKNLVFIVL